MFLYYKLPFVIQKPPCFRGKDYRSEVAMRTIRKINELRGEFSHTIEVGASGFCAYENTTCTDRPQYRSIGKTILFCVFSDFSNTCGQLVYLTRFTCTEALIRAFRVFFCIEKWKGNITPPTQITILRKQVRKKITKCA